MSSRSFWALALLLMPATTVATAQQTPTQRSYGPSDQPAANATSPAMLREDMRKLWSDHVIWTRDYIIAAVADQPDAQAASARLLKNQEDIGHAVAAYYGAQAGDKLTGLLKEHITIAVDLIKAAKTHDKGTIDQANEKWQKNADDLADFLSKANPNWQRGPVLELLKTHLSTTTDEVQARLDKKWDDDVKAFDAVYDHVLRFADVLSDGLVKQFPEKFIQTAAAR